MTQRQLMQMTADEVAAFVDENWRAQVATHNPDSSIHLVPLAYMRLDGLVGFWTDPASQKVKNLRRDPRITCLIEAGSSVADFRAVQLVGRAILLDDPEGSRRAGEALFTRTRGALDDELHALIASLVPVRVGVLVEPERVVSWDHRKLGQSKLSDLGS